MLNIWLGYRLYRGIPYSGIPYSHVIYDYFHNWEGFQTNVDRKFKKLH